LVLIFSISAWVAHPGSLRHPLGIPTEQNKALAILLANELSGLLRVTLADQQTSVPMLCDRSNPDLGTGLHLLVIVEYSARENHISGMSGLRD
jgi:hypothetical protein